MMEVEYELTPEDLTAFYRYHRKHLPASKLRIEPIAGIGIWITCCLFIFAIVGATVLRLESFIVPVLLVFGVSFWFSMGWYTTKWMTPPTTLRSLQNRKDAEKVLGWGRLTLDDQGIHIASRFSSSFFRWNGIDKVEATDEYIFIYLMSYNAQIIPLRAFTDDRAFNAFAEAAKRYQGTASDAVRQEVGERRRPTGIQASDYSRKSGTVEGIVPKEGGQ